MNFEKIKQTKFAKSSISSSKLENIFGGADTNGLSGRDVGQGVVETWMEDTTGTDGGLMYTTTDYQICDDLTP